MTKEEQEYLALLTLLGRVSEETKSIVTADPNRLRDAEGLGVKFYFHSASILYLSRGTIITDFPLGEINCVDFASISVVARAAFEAFLIFHHVFIAPKTNQLRNFRYWAWLLSGLCERQKFPATTPYHRKQKENEKKEMKDLHKKLCSNPEFVKLLKNQKANIKKGRWRLDGWKKMARDAGLDELHASSIYAYLCGYAHSDSLSVLQMYHAKLREQQERLLRIAVQNTMIATANMIFLYCDLFPDGKNALRKNPEAAQIAREWRGIGHGEYD